MTLSYPMGLLPSRHRPLEPQRSPGIEPRVDLRHLVPVVGRQEREEVDDAADGLRPEEDVAAPLHDLDPAHPLGHRHVVDVRLRVRIDRHGDAVLEDEHAPRAAGIEPVDPHVEAQPSSGLRRGRQPGDAAEDLGDVRRLLALDLLGRHQRARAGHLLQRVCLVPDDAHLGDRLLRRRGAGGGGGSSARASAGTSRPLAARPHARRVSAVLTAPCRSPSCCNRATAPGSPSPRCTASSRTGPWRGSRRTRCRAGTGESRSPCCTKT
jgi:hypothetical protein